MVFISSGEMGVVKGCYQLVSYVRSISFTFLLFICFIYFIFCKMCVCFFFRQNVNEMDLT